MYKIYRWTILLYIFTLCNSNIVYDNNIASSKLKKDSNDDELNFQIYPAKNLNQFNENNLPKIEGNLKYLEDNSNRKLLNEYKNNNNNMLIQIVIMWIFFSIN